ncbi:hypothetical protein [Agrobacterium pusense]|uniref:hypothetical protein n=1 Tax=Agrobacterium pusense TaxID=648995 RepID=UPI000512BB75|nr:hypothetical protein [Agrobacterium pusense]ANV22857.1 hypothetical protein BA939_02140 [Rhizobium sp. S41]KGE79984.1 hypothetical protein LW14_25845 [Rhizobium sp. H41]QWW75119.1 hypothetical protein KP800_06540 [Agrobacterium pusense]
MSNVSQLPNNDALFVCFSYDDKTGATTFLLEKFIGGQRTRVGEYQTMADLVSAMDEISGIYRSGGAA